MLPVVVVTYANVGAASLSTGTISLLLMILLVRVTVGGRLRHSLRRRGFPTQNQGFGVANPDRITSSRGHEGF